MAEAGGVAAPDRSIDEVAVEARRRSGRPSREEEGVLTTRILDAALDEFRSKGYAAASIEAIAAAAQASRNAVYRRYPDKHALFRAVLLVQIARLQKEVELLVHDEEDPLLALKRTIRIYFDFSLHPLALDLLRIVVSEARQFADLAAEMTSPLAAGLGERLCVLIRSAQAAGLLKLGPPELWRDVLRRLIVDGPRWQALGGWDWNEAAIQAEFERMWPIFLGIAGKH